MVDIREGRGTLIIQKDSSSVQQYENRLFGLTGIYPLEYEFLFTQPFVKMP